MVLLKNKIQADWYVLSKDLIPLVEQMWYVIDSNSIRLNTYIDPAVREELFEINRKLYNLIIESEGGR